MILVFCLFFSLAFTFLSTSQDQESLYESHEKHHNKSLCCLCSSENLLPVVLPVTIIPFVLQKQELLSMSHFKVFAPSDPLLNPCSHEVTANCNAPSPSCSLLPFKKIQHSFSPPHTAVPDLSQHFNTSASAKWPVSD